MLESLIVCSACNHLGFFNGFHGSISAWMLWTLNQHGNISMTNISWLSFNDISIAMVLASTSYSDVLNLLCANWLTSFALDDMIFYLGKLFSFVIAIDKNFNRFLRNPANIIYISLIKQHNFFTVYFSSQNRTLYSPKHIYIIINLIENPHFCVNRMIWPWHLFTVILLNRFFV